jgi:hypothetical protein
MSFRYADQQKQLLGSNGFELSARVGEAAKSRIMAQNNNKIE